MGFDLSDIEVTYTESLVSRRIPVSLDAPSKMRVENRPHQKLHHDLLAIINESSDYLISCSAVISLVD